MQTIKQKRVKKNK